MGAPPATRSQRGARGAPTRVSPVSGSSFVLFLALSLSPEHRPAVAIDPLAINRPLLPCHRTLPGTALPSGTSVALKATSHQHLGFFHCLGRRVHPARVLWTWRCSVPQFPWLGVAWENSAHPIQEHLEMKGTIPPWFFPSGGSGPTQLLPWPPALPRRLQEPPNTFRVEIRCCSP